VAKHTSLHVGTMKAWGGSAHVATQEGGNPTGLKFDSTSNFKHYCIYRVCLSNASH
jgi:hypothetical protein